MNAVTMQGDAPTARQDHVRVRRLTRPPWLTAGRKRPGAETRSVSAAWCVGLSPLKGGLSGSQLMVHGSRLTTARRGAYSAFSILRWSTTVPNSLARVEVRSSETVKPRRS